MFLFNEFSSKATYNKGIQRCGIQPKNRKNYANTIILLNILKSFKCYIKKKKKNPIRDGELFEISGASTLCRQ